MNGFLIPNEALQAYGIHVFNHPDGILLLTADHPSQAIVNALFRYPTASGDYLGVKVR